LESGVRSVLAFGRPRRGVEVPQTPLPEIIVTTRDYERLSNVLASLPDNHEVGRMLEAELDRAEVLEPYEVPSDVVTMNSRVLVEDLESGEQLSVTLVYPASADFQAGRLSVLAPVGAALLGLRAGQTIEWPLPGGRKKRVRVAAVEWQPEAAGEDHL